MRWAAALGWIAYRYRYIRDGTIILVAVLILFELREIRDEVDAVSYGIHAANRDAETHSNEAQRLLRLIDHSIQVLQFR